MSRPVSRIADLARGRLIGVLLDAAPPVPAGADAEDADRVRLLVALLMGGLEGADDAEFDPGGRAFSGALALADDWQRRGLPLDRACAAVVALRQAAWELLLGRLQGETDRGIGLLQRLDRRVDALFEAVVAGYADREESGIYDPGTGAVTPELFDRLLTGEVERGRRYGRPFAVLLVVLEPAAGNGESEVAEAGEGLLRRLGSALSLVSRQVDTVARRGAHQFAILMPETGAEAGWVLAERVRALLAAAAASEESIPLQRIRIGLVCYPRDGQTVNGVFRSIEGAHLRELREDAGGPVSVAARVGRTPAEDESSSVGRATPPRAAARPPELGESVPLVRTPAEAARRRLREDVATLRRQQDDLRWRIAEVGRRLEEDDPESAT